MLRALANSAIHPSEVGKWVVIYVIRYVDYGVKAYRGWLGRSMPAGSICWSRVRYAGYGRRLICAVPGYYSQCWSVTTSTIVKRRWHVLRMLSGAIPSTWALALAFSFRRITWPCDIDHVTALVADAGLRAVSVYQIRRS